MKPSNILKVYIGTIAAFSASFYLLGTCHFDEELGIVKSIYFSVITITTLGYGDITPKSDIAMILTAIESIAGVIIMGLFLSSIWKKYSDDSEVKHAKQLEEQSKQEQINFAKQLEDQAKREDINRFLSYASYWRSIITDYQSAILDIASSECIETSEFTFKFSDFKEMFDASDSFESTSSKIEIYYKIEEELQTELKYILANQLSGDDYEIVQIRNTISIFLADIRRTGAAKHMLLSYSSLPEDDVTKREIIDAIESDFTIGELGKKAAILRSFFNSIYLKLLNSHKIDDQFVEIAKLFEKHNK